MTGRSAGQQQRTMKIPSLHTDLAEQIPRSWRGIESDGQDTIKRRLPRMAKDGRATRRIESVIRKVKTRHLAIHGDSCAVRLSENSVHLVVTSPPYWTLKEYPRSDSQLGRIADYGRFLSSLDRVWKNCFDALVPGGRLICVVGDVCLSRRRNGGRHTVVPLHAAIQERCVRIGFDNLAPIIWHKIGNARYEGIGGTGTFLGKPYEPNAVIKNDIEYILMLRKPGGYRSPSAMARMASIIPKKCHSEWFRQIWNGPSGASTRVHPAPFPVEIAERLVRMFSFVGDTVYDPFAGSGTTQYAASKWGRNSIGTEIEGTYVKMIKKRMHDRGVEIESVRPADTPGCHRRPLQYGRGRQQEAVI